MEGILTLRSRLNQTASSVVVDECPASDVWLKWSIYKMSRDSDEKNLRKLPSEAADLTALTGAIQQFSIQNLPNPPLYQSFMNEIVQNK